MLAEIHIQAVEAEIAALDAELQPLVARIEQLHELRNALEVVKGAGATSLPAPSSIDIDESQHARGDKTMTMRRYVIMAGDSGVTRHQIVQHSKPVKGHPNFPYRFITRMKETGELREVGERFIATDKMRSKMKRG